MYFRSSSDILAGRTKSVQIDIAILVFIIIYIIVNINKKQRLHSMP